MSRSPRAIAALAAMLLAGTFVTACSSGTGETTDGATDDTTASTAPKIVATTQVWADVASAVTGDEVESIIQGSSIDPHHFEPSAKDLARINEADIVVANGGAYDAALYTVTDQDKIVHAIPLVDEAEEHNHDHADHDHGPATSLDEIEHAWFSPEKVRQVANELAEKTGGDAGDVDKRMLDIEAKLQHIQHLHIGMTETIPAGLVWGSELHDITPEEYLHAAMNHQDPSAAAIAKFLEEIEHRDVDLLFVNPQSTNSATQRLVEAAEANNVPVVELYETPPAGKNFLDYMEEVVAQVAEIADSAEPIDHAELESHSH